MFSYMLMQRPNETHKNNTRNLYTLAGVTAWVAVLLLPSPVGYSGLAFDAFFRPGQETYAFERTRTDIVESRRYER